MTGYDLRTLLATVADGRTSVADAERRLAHSGFEDLGFARVDHQRSTRQGFGEVIYGASKTPEQIAGIAQAMLHAGSNVLCTRASDAAYAAVKIIADDAVFYQGARAITVVRSPAAALGHVGVLCAGTSDLPVAEEAAVCAEYLGAKVSRINDVGVAGVHRLLSAHEVLRALDVAIVVAGMEGALPSVVGGLIAAPVIAVPTSVGYGASFGGVAALLGMLNSCASGVTVVNIDNGFGAAAAAHRILRAPTRR